MKKSMIWIGVSALSLWLCLPYASRADEQASSHVSARIDRTSSLALDHARSKTEDAGSVWSEWGLSRPEWRRYKTLMRGIRGALSDPRISPIEVLGIHARDPEERRRYARLWTRMLREDTERVLAFQRAVHEAGAELYAGMPLIDPEMLRALRAESASASASEKSNRLALFTTTHCDARCASNMPRWIRRVAGHGRLDIYIVGAATDDALRAWAKRMRIDPAVVRERVVTLNHDDGALAARFPDYRKRVDRGQYLLFARENGKWRRMDDEH